MNTTERIFIRENIDTDINRLLLSKGRYREVDMEYCVNQIVARKKGLGKLQDWADNFDIEFPAPVSVEQSSSLSTALYKQRFCNGGVVADITGGFGVDSWFLSQVSSGVDYFEINPDLFITVKSNFTILKAENIRVFNQSFTEFRDSLDNYDLIYADPSRRINENKRVIKLSDYEPSIPAIKRELFDKSERLLIKISPMADISATLEELPETTQIHILSVKNECKELLFLLERESKDIDPLVFGINMDETGRILSKFTFKRGEEGVAQNTIADIPALYLYEPSGSIMKSGAFKLISSVYKVDKLHKHTHLYTSDILIPDFPGRVFNVLSVEEFSNRSINNLRKKIDKANISARNFPMSVNELRHRLSIDDGGDKYIFGVTLKDDKRALIICSKAD